MTDTPPRQVPNPFGSPFVSSGAEVFQMFKHESLFNVVWECHSLPFRNRPEAGHIPAYVGRREHASASSLCLGTTGESGLEVSRSGGNWSSLVSCNRCISSAYGREPSSFLHLDGERTLVSEAAWAKFPAAYGTYTSRMTSSRNGGALCRFVLVPWGTNVQHGNLATRYASHAMPS
jgi:hypothetical protein